MSKTHNLLVRDQWIVLIIGCLVTAAARSATERQSIDIIHKGCFHGDEVSEQSSGQWDALYNQGATFVLVTRSVRVAPCEELYDEPGQKTGREVVVDAEGTPVFLVRGLGHVGRKPLRIVTAFPEKPREDIPSGSGWKYVRPGEQLRLVLNEAEYRLSAAGGYDPARPESDRLVVGYRLTLTGPDGRSQELPAPDRFAEDGVPTLMWAGDLDQDGKLDLYMDTTNHYNVGNHVLLLSSHAAPGKLVRLVASRRYVGC